MDDINKISELDSQDMFQMVFDWPELVEELMNQSFEIPGHVTVGSYTISYSKPISQVLICGMGGSAVSGDYLQTYLENVAPFPIFVQRNYNIPAFVSKDTLIILISYSGNTEETISCLIGAIKKSAKIIGLGSGGNLENFFTNHKLPFFLIPSGFQPRAAFSLLFFPLLRILDSMNLISFNKSVFGEVISLFRELRLDLRPQKQCTENQAKKIAQKLHGRIPVIWSPFRCVANRMKCQLNENSKVLAMSEELPELNHNHIVGWESWKNENPFILIAFRFEAEHPNVRLRFEITKEIIEKKVEVIEVHSKGTNFLSQLFSITYIGDYISMYLAILNGFDPSSVDSIAYLKQQMEQREHTQTKLSEALTALSGEK
ncbi:MAG: bifunctional phosphoglucose/phosphomannose isomerase [Candidatus Hermodarchaeota archaeon]